MHEGGAAIAGRPGPLAHLTRTVDARLGRTDEEGLWLAATLAIGAIAAGTLLSQGLVEPMRVQNDARQFVFWMARWSDPTLFADDLLAEYWQSVSPWFYRAIFYTLHLIGIGPVLGAKLVAAALLPITGLAAYRLTRGIGGDPLAAFVTGAAIIVLSGAEDIVVSATPRSLWPALFILVLDGLVRRSIAQTAIAQFLLAGTYPHMALIAATVIGLTFLKWDPRLGIDLSGRRLVLVGTCAGATVAGLLPFVVQTDAFGPVATFADIRSIPTFSSGGRGAVLEPAGNMNLACGDRTGFINFARCGGFASPVFVAAFILIAAAPVWMACSFASSRGATGTPIYLFVLIASVLWFTIAALVVFRLHLPSRFAGDLLEYLAVLAAAPLLAGLVRLAWSRGSGPGWMRAALSATTVLLLAGFVLGAVLVNPRYVVPRRPELVRHLAAMPADALIAGFVRDLDNVPALARRKVLFTWEHAIAYQLGYFRRIEARMRDMAELELTPDPAVLADRLASHGVDLYLVDQDLIVARQVERAFRGFIGGWIDELRVRLGDAPTALGRLAPGCTEARVDTILVLDARCLIERARRT